MGSARADDTAPIAALPTVTSLVTVKDTPTAWILDNGLVKATVSKKNGNMTQLTYRGVDLIGRGGNWEETPSGEVKASLTIDPASTNGDRAEISLKGMNGKLDIETRYCMERGVSGFYTYGIFTHKAGYPDAGIGEGRFCIEGRPIMDWLSVDADRNMLMASGQDFEAGPTIHAKEQHILGTGVYKNSVEHKYNYCAIMYRTPAWGWSSTAEHIGLFFMNPSMEYIGGGSEKVDLLSHLSATMLDYWTSGHYAGGTNVHIPAGEEWNKVVGPIFVYCNTLANPRTPSQSDLDALVATSGNGNPSVPDAWKQNGLALWQDAVAQAKVQRAKWPFDWVNGVDYPKKAERGNITGQFVLDDSQATTPKLPNLTVGVAHPDYQGSGSPFQLRAGNGTNITWPHDGNYYQFWTDGTDDGKFTIENIRPGNYTLHAFANGVLGEYEQASVTVAAGQTLDLGQIKWIPVRYGKQIWEIGYPNRNASEFFKGDGANVWRWGWCVRYPLLFPNDLTYTVGQSDWSKDWFFEQVPHGENRSWLNPAAEDPANQPFGWVMAGTEGKDMWKTIGHGRDTTWTIKFTMDASSRGTATLRLALAGADSTPLLVAVNGKKVGGIRPVSTNAIRYNTDKGVWQEKALPFAASILRSGKNEMPLPVPAGDLTSGVVYDYLRLEVDPGKTPPPPGSNDIAPPLPPHGKPDKDDDEG